jgi:hypothetical protein
VQKRFFALRNLDRLWQSIPRLDHHCDGLIFTPLCERIHAGRQFSMLKWKWATEHTIDARVQWERADNGDRFRLQVVDGKQMLDWSVLEEPHAQECRELGLGAHRDGAIVECRYLPELQCWRVERLRLDKAVPNTRLTADQTLQNIAENITLEELYLVAEQCMNKYNSKQNSKRKDHDRPTSRADAHHTLSPPRAESPPYGVGVSRTATPPYSAPSPPRADSYHPSPPRTESPPYSAPSPPRQQPEVEYTPPSFVHPARARLMQNASTPTQSTPTDKPFAAPSVQPGDLMSALSALNGLLGAAQKK